MRWERWLQLFLLGGRGLCSEELTLKTRCAWPSKETGRHLLAAKQRSWMRTKWWSRLGEEAGTGSN